MLKAKADAAANKTKKTTVGKTGVAQKPATPVPAPDAMTTKAVEAQNDAAKKTAQAAKKADHAEAKNAASAAKKAAHDGKKEAHKEKAEA